VNISSLSSSWPLLQARSAISNTAGNNATVAQGTSMGSVTGNSKNDGDTFQLSLSAAMMMSGTMQSQSSNNNVGSDLSNLLTKVQGGTATSNDLQSMASELQQVVQASNSQNQTANSGTIGNDIGSFLDKVANGTVSSSDLQTMQSELQQAQQSGSGSVQGHHHHHHHHGGGAVSSTSDASTASSIGSDLNGFMDKVVKGTATDSDLKGMETEMASLLQGSNTTNNTQGVSPVTGSNMNSTNAIQNINAVSQAFSNSAMNAYNTQAYFDFTTPSWT
jgi:hypothetical protein